MSVPGWSSGWGSATRRPRPTKTKRQKANRTDLLTAHHPVGSPPRREEYTQTRAGDRRPALLPAGAKFADVIASSTARDAPHTYTPVSLRRLSNQVTRQRSCSPYTKQVRVVLHSTWTPSSMPSSTRYHPRRRSAPSGTCSRSTAVPITRKPRHQPRRPAPPPATPPRSAPAARTPAPGARARSRSGGGTRRTSRGTATAGRGSVAAASPRRPRAPARASASQRGTRRVTRGRPAVTGRSTAA